MAASTEDREGEPIRPRACLRRLPVPSRTLSFLNMFNEARRVLRLSNNAHILHACFAALRDRRNGMRIRPVGLIAITIALVGIAVAAVGFWPAATPQVGSPTRPDPPPAPPIQGP